MDDNNYKLILSGKGLTVEREVSESVASRILTIVLGATAGNASTHPEISVEISPASAPLTGAASPKAFMAAKRPTTDIERITCLAYYLTHIRGVEHFKTEELTTLNREAAQPTFSNATVTARNAVQRNFLSLAGGAKKQITAYGEELVQAMPDREKVRTVLENIPARKRKIGRKKDNVNIEN